MSAPIIIVPEEYVLSRLSYSDCLLTSSALDVSVTATRCQNLVIDAGHISVESKLADKEAIREVQGKKNRSYTSADFEQLESLMYDNFSVRLNDTQVCPIYLFVSTV